MAEHGLSSMQLESYSNLLHRTQHAYLGQTKSCTKCLFLTQTDHNRRETCSPVKLHFIQGSAPADTKNDCGSVRTLCSLCSCQPCLLQEESKLSNKLVGMRSFQRCFSTMFQSALKTDCQTLHTCQIKRKKKCSRQGHEDTNRQTKYRYYVLESSPSKMSSTAVHV